MERRRLFSLVLVLLAAAGTIAFGPAVSGSTTVSEVGGGATGVQVKARAVGIGVGGVSGAFANVAEPVVILPASGSEEPIVKDTAGESVAILAADVEFHVARVSTHGGLDGDPYAESTADVVDVRIGSSEIRAVSTHCIWDQAGAEASTVLTFADGRTVEPQPNTEVEIPGIGKAVVNHQERQTLSNGAEVIVVSGIRLEVEDSTVASGTLEVDVAFSSCDPLRLPVETGVGVISSAE